MPPLAKSVLIGVSSVGEVLTPYGTPADVSWGATEQDGVTIAFDGEMVNVMSGQAKVLEESYMSAQRITLTLRLQYTDLLNIARALGLTDATLTGDLQAGTPIAEVLDPLSTAIGTREFYLYVITPGPRSTRRWEFRRCKVQPGFSLTLASNAHQRLELTFDVLRPKQATFENKPFKVTDAV